MPRQADPETERKKLLRAYHEIPEAVIDDLRATYGRSSITSDFNPNRTMVLEGCRLVLLKIEEMREEAAKYAGGTEPTTVITDAEPDADDGAEREQRPIFRFTG